MAALAMRMLKPMRSINGRSVQLKPYSDPYYDSAEHRAWRHAVFVRAGFQCEWVEGGIRCRATRYNARLYADHVIERRDRPDLETDPSNGQCLCARHHTAKTVRARAQRMRA